MGLMTRVFVGVLDVERTSPLLTMNPKRIAILKKTTKKGFTQYETIAEFHRDYAIEDYPTHAHINDATELIMIGVGPEDKSFIIKDFEAIERRS